MLHSQGIFERVWTYVDNVVASTTAKQEDIVRLKHFFIFILCGLPTMILFGLHNLMVANLGLCVLIFISGAGLYIGWLLLLRNPGNRNIYRLNGIAFGTLLLYMFLIGGDGGSKALWVFTFPLIAFFLLGKKEGVIWVSCLLTLSLCLYYLPTPFITKFSYNTPYLIRFIIIYIIISTVTYWFEHFRSSYQSELQTEHQRFKEILFHSRDILYRRDLQTGKYQYLSRAFQDLLGYSSAEMTRLLYRDVHDLIHPDDRKEHDAIIPKVVNSKPEESIADPIELRMRNKKGEYLWFSDQIAVVHDSSGKPEAIIGSNREISTERHMRLALQDAKKQLVTILNSIDAHIYVADMKTHHILFMNNKMKDAFGYDKEGKICFEEFRHEKHRCDHCSNSKLLDQDGNPTGLFEWQGQNPLTNKWYNNYDRAIQWIDGRWVRLQIAVDITRLKYLEEEREKTADIVNRARNLEAIGILAGGIAHDFNNLLQIILGNLILAEKDLSLTSNTKGYLQECKKAADNARELANRMVTLSPVSSQIKLKVDLTPILNTLASQIVEKTESEIEISTNIDPDIHQVPVDYNQIATAFSNIITNSCESMPGSGRLTISAKNYIHSYLEKDAAREIQEGEYNKITIGDTGSGLSSSELKKIFDPYYSTKQRSTYKGLGLGMAITYSIITQHNGYIFVTSRKNQGTEVTVYLPTNL